MRHISIPELQSKFKIPNSKSILDSKSCYILHSQRQLLLTLKYLSYPNPITQIKTELSGNIMTTKLKLKQTEIHKENYFKLNTFQNKYLKIQSSLEVRGEHEGLALVRVEGRRREHAHERQADKQWDPQALRQLGNRHLGRVLGRGLLQLLDAALLVELVVVVGADLAVEPLFTDISIL
ncbi:Hypothetical_protein [Hexamita inflata]|uniref:Hypothetical_protein n=1 Tax=Hexamita inflata TaxID=28002 RepID=A0AA86QE34_9EUKA|nr:Hypothetical protein HINF_LOCUS42192 [Hexamita inflata]